MQNTFKRLSLLILLSLAQLAIIVGQDINKDAEPSGKILEVKIGDAIPPAKIPLRSDRPTGFWTPLVPRIKDWRPPAGQEPSQAVSFSARLVGERAELAICAVGRNRCQEKAEIVGDYSMSVGDVVTVNELRKFGYESIMVRMIENVPTPAGVPVVDNKTQSIRVTVSPAVSTLPAFNFHLTNDSKKLVMAVAWHTETWGRFLLSSLLQGEHGKELMGISGKHDMTIRTGTEEVLAAGVTLIIDGVVFEDGTFEGSPGAAAQFQSIQTGRRIALARLLPMLHAASKSERIDIASTVDRIEATVERNAPATMVKSSSDRLISETADRLLQLKSTLPNADEDKVRKSLIELTDLYQKWFDRLSRYQ